MPDFTRISYASLDIDRRIFAKRSALCLLRSSDDSAQYEPVPGFSAGDGMLLSGWQPLDLGDGVHLRIKIAESDVTGIVELVILQVEAVAFAREGSAGFQLFSVSAVDPPSLASDRTWTLSCECLGEAWVPPSPFVPETSGPDFTRIAAASLDIDRKIFAKDATIVLLQSMAGSPHYMPIPTVGFGTGHPSSGWRPIDLGDGATLRLEIAEIGDVTPDVLRSLEAVAYSRGVINGVLESPRLYSVSHIDYPNIQSSRVHKIRLDYLGEDWVMPALPQVHQGEWLGAEYITRWD